MIYASKLFLPDKFQEINFIKNESRTYLGSFYPFKLFADKGLTEIRFDSITIFYGGNGSGKSTLINILARKLQSVRYSNFNDAPLFDTYVEKCHVEYYKTPSNSCVLTSDDVFDYVLNARAVNDKLGERRDKVVERYFQVQEEYRRNPEIRRLNGIDDLERWKEVSHILSPKKSMSSFVKKQVAERDVNLGSNGETSLQYFVDRMEDEGIFLLDEPENSLSIDFQMKLVDYILATARTTGTQFVIATHSPIFLSIKNARIYNLDTNPVEVCDWTELPNVRKYYDFFMGHMVEFEKSKELIEAREAVRKNLEEKEKSNLRLSGREYSKRLEGYSYETLKLISYLGGFDRETLLLSNEITTNPNLDEEEVVHKLLKLKEETIKKQSDIIRQTWDEEDY